MASEVHQRSSRGLKSANLEDVDNSRSSKLCIGRTILTFYWYVHLLKSIAMDILYFTGSVEEESEFFVVPHPLILVGIPYGIFLTFLSALFPTSIPSFLPLGPLATWLGLTFPALMNFLSIFVIVTHLGEPFYVLHLVHKKGIRRRQALLWVASAVFYGIFGAWPLYFQDFYQSAGQDIYCNLPLSIC